MYSFFSNEGISITQNVPASVKPGEEFVVELNVNRGTIAGFAKLQQELPEGCTAKVKESATGNFTFADRQIKIIWMSVPTDASFKVSYTVTVPAGINVSQFELAGKISYIENNEKKTFEITPKSITVSGVTATASASPTETKTTPTETASTNTAAAPVETNTAVQYHNYSYRNSSNYYSYRNKYSCKHPKNGCSCKFRCINLRENGYHNC